MKIRYKILITILIVAVLDCIILFLIDNRHSYEKVSSSSISEKNDIKNENMQAENEEKKTENETEFENENTELVQTNKTEETEETSDLKEAEQENDNEKKALILAKKKWGEDSSVYFVNEGKENGKYMVSVRSKQTTAAITYYKINLTTGEIEADI